MKGYFFTDKTKISNFITQCNGEFYYHGNVEKLLNYIIDNKIFEWQKTFKVNEIDMEWEEYWKNDFYEYETAGSFDSPKDSHVQLKYIKRPEHPPPRNYTEIIETMPFENSILLKEILFDDDIEDFYCHKLNADIAKKILCENWKF